MEDKSTEQTSAVKQSPNNEELLKILKSRLSVAKKFSKKPHEAMKKWIKEYEIENFADTDEVRDKVRIGYIFRKTEQDQPAIFDDQPEIFIKGRSRAIKEVEPVINSIYDYLWDIQNLEETIESAGLYFTLLGLAFVESPYVTKTKTVQEPMVDEMGQPVLDETGQPVMQDYEMPVIDNPMAETGDIFKYHFSPETVFNPVLDYEHCPYYFRERVYAVDKVEAMFGKRVEATETLKLNDSDADSEIQSEIEQSTIAKDDMKRVNVYEYYGCLPQNVAQSLNTNSEWKYDKDYHIWMTANEILQAEECPYVVKPLFPIGNYGLANKFWKFGDAKHLMPLVQEYEMYRSQILQHTRKMANPKPLIPTNANIDEKAFSDPRVGKSVKYSGPVAPSYLSPAQLGGEVATGTEMVKSDLEKTSGSFDLAGGGSQSTVKTPRGIQVYAEAADKNIARKRKKISRLIRQLVLFQFGQLSMFWKPEDNHVLEVADENVQVTAEVLQLLDYVSINRKIDIEAESLSVNKVQMKQDALNLWSEAKEHPDVFKLPEMARYLLQTGYSMKDADRFVYTEEELAQIQQNTQPPVPTVSIRADAQSPIGAQLLENSGLIQPGQAQDMVVQQQVIADQVAQAPALQDTMQNNEAPQPQFQQ